MSIIINPKDLPDYPHIKKISDHLWTDREIGKAAIMVGAGFSKNAKKVNAMVEEFPLWYDLGEKMFNELYSDLNISSNHLLNLKKEKTSGLGVLKLANEYEVFFGRHQLNEFIKKNLPDDKYVPDELHISLLNLPWSDIFTTNYDTLLERTRTHIFDRKYDLVLTKEDIPGKMKPRIIKLHGTLPSNLPFIFTEEDYRIYPHDFAPFVNTVQQSMMENIFCLIGFSGSDPNFLSWRGWIKDNLGNNTPIIYLVGLFSHSQSERKLLENNFIRIIDLSPIFPDTTWKKNRHYEATKWFLDLLTLSKPIKKINWPLFKK